jgi:glycosyltransferase involved in cell wall biosynthesis
MISGCQAQAEIDISGITVAVVTAKVTGGTSGGAERLYSGLCDGLSKIGANVEMVPVPADEPTFESILQNYEYCANLDLSNFDLVISTKAPTFAVKHPRNVMYLVHTVRVFDDMFMDTFQKPMREHYVQRAKIHRLDFEAMSCLRARFAIGNEVARRLYRWRGMDAEVLHPPLAMGGFSEGPQGDYFFLPGRLHPWKRVDLVIESVKRSELPFRLVIAGTGEDEERLKRIAGDDPRIVFEGRISDERLIQLYSNSLAVPFCPVREDYGYVTLEAFASGKPVITCVDSGEPVHFVQHEENGLVSVPEPEALRQSLEWIFQNRDRAGIMGKKGAESVSAMSWRNVASRLIEAGINGQKPFQKKTRVSVLDMQPIEPAVGGGRLRLIGLYHNLGDRLKTSYLGTYDWPGEKYRNHFLSDTLEETDIPLSPQHHIAAGELRSGANGKTVIDLSFGRLGYLSPEYVQGALAAARSADILIFSHPWVFPLLENSISPKQFVVYDSQNVEGYLRAQLLDERNPVEADLLRYVVDVENRLGCRANLILSCSGEDMHRFNRIYEFPLEKMCVLPNGVMAFSENTMQRPRKNSARRKLGIKENCFLAVFIGSPYGPNIEAAEFICENLAPVLPDTLFVIAGGVGSQITCDKKNVLLTGALDEEGKRDWLSAADIAVNPMFSGSGTNIKMFDFMAYHLPVVTTSTGARGIETGSGKPFLVVPPDREAFVQAVQNLRDEELRHSMGNEARRIVEEDYSWEKISPHAGRILLSRLFYAEQPRPLFSIVVLSNGQKEPLLGLFECLQGQVERDFEVIVADCGQEKTSVIPRLLSSPLEHVHFPGAGLESAGKKAAEIASGKVIVFIQNAFRPNHEWLLEARSIFRSELITGAQNVFAADACSSFFWKASFTPVSGGIGLSGNPLFIRSDALNRSEGLVESTRKHRGDSSCEKGLIPERKVLSGFQEEKSIGWISTWNTKCGIAAYSKHLLETFPQGAVTVFAPFGGEITEEDGDNVRRCWSMDKDTYGCLEQEIEKARNRILVIQFHYGFFHFTEFAGFLEKQVERGRKVVIMMHCSTDPLNNPEKRMAILAPSLRKCHGILVHSIGDLDRLYLNDLSKNVLLFPHGILPYDSSEQAGRKNGDSFLVSSYGYFRPHKGLMELVRAIGILRKKGKNVSLRMVNAQYPVPESEKEIHLVRNAVREMGMDGTVEFFTDYLEDEESLSLLAESDLVVFPYQNSSESSSAAVRQGIAAGRPVAVTPLEIFDDVAPAVFQLPGRSPEEIADGIESLMGHITSRPVEYTRKMDLASQWRQHHIFPKLAEQLLEFLVRNENAR